MQEVWNGGRECVQMQRAGRGGADAACGKGLQMALCDEGVQVQRTGKGVSMGH